MFAHPRPKPIAFAPDADENGEDSEVNSRNGIFAGKPVSIYRTFHERRVFGNPAQKFIYLFIKNQLTPFKYELYNSVGQLVLNGELAANESTIDISKISNGFYVF